jgi:hypothetical protein
MGVEVDQQSGMHARGFQIRHQLGLMNIVETGHRFEFNDNLSFHNQVYALSPQVNTSVPD